jgi:hypothetical protein
MIVNLAASSDGHGLIPVAVVVALITAGATFIIGWLSLRGQKETFRWQRDHATKQIDLMQSGQITDRFMRAIEHLGSSSSSVRTGAIFALERIARESASDRPHIVSTLAALVRERLPASVVGDGGYVQVLMQRAPDAQAAMTALCRPPLSDDRRDSSQIGGLDLSRTDLRRASLRLRGAMPNCPPGSTGSWTCWPGHSPERAHTTRRSQLSVAVPVQGESSFPVCRRAAEAHREDLSIRTEHGAWQAYAVVDATARAAGVQTGQAAARHCSRRGGAVPRREPPGATGWCRCFPSPW